jgi:hypothetical protein
MFPANNIELPGPGRKWTPARIHTTVTPSRASSASRFVFRCCFAQTTCWHPLRMCLAFITVLSIFTDHSIWPTVSVQCHAAPFPYWTRHEMSAACTSSVVFQNSFWTYHLSSDIPAPYGGLITSVKHLIASTSLYSKNDELSFENWLEIGECVQNEKLLPQ